MNRPLSLPRRDFLKAAAAMTVAAQMVPGANAAFKSTAPALIDVNVHLGHWPLRGLPAEGPEDLVTLLRDHGVGQAWTGSFDALLHKDLGAVNARLADDCRRHGRGLLVPMGTVNPRAPDWEEEARRCFEAHRMPGLRLFPNYHGYTLDDDGLLRLLHMAADRGVVVQLALLMEDERMMHPLLRVVPVDPAPLIEVVRQVPKLRLVLLNALGKVRAQPLLRLVAAGDVAFDIATLEGVAGIEQLLGQVPLDRLLFGSHAPLYYFEAAALKLKESNLSQAQLLAIRSSNAQRLLTTSRI